MGKPDKPKSYGTKEHFLARKNVIKKHASSQMKK